MKKSVLIAIQPYWVFLIIAKAMGWNIPQDKTVEVRKGFPKDTAWNKRTHIYCSKNKKSFSRIPKEYQPFMKKFLGKVIGEFVCDNVMRFTKYSGWLSDIQNYDISLKHLQETMLSCDELWKYGNGKPLYGWRISDLKIYDKPKELGDFMVLKKCVSCKYSGYESSACAYDEDCIIPMPLKRPFQSWGYVEDIVT